MLVFKLDFEAKLLVRFLWNLERDFERVEILFKDWYKFFFDFVEEPRWKFFFVC